MILGIGTDLCDIGRIERALERFGERFAERILVASELERFFHLRARSLQSTVFERDLGQAEVALGEPGVQLHRFLERRPRAMGGGIGGHLLPRQQHPAARHLDERRPRQRTTSLGAREAKPIRPGAAPTS